jgi:hypothetical protein
MQMRERERRLPLCCPWNICSPFSLVYCFIYKYFFLFVFYSSAKLDNPEIDSHTGKTTTLGKWRSKLLGSFSYRYHGQAGRRYFTFETKGEMGRSWNGWMVSSSPFPLHG